MDDCTKDGNKFQGVTEPSTFPEELHPSYTPPPCNLPVTPRKYEGEDYYGAADVAKILGVTRIAVLKWHEKGLFTADTRAHDGRYLYLVERVMQLKSVYRPDWNQPAYIAHVDEPPPEKTESEPKNDDDAKYRKKIADDIAVAQHQLDDLPETELRGLPKDFLRRFEVGYLPNYQHQKLTSSRRTSRFIFKLGDDNDPPSINAILTPSGREFFKNRRGNFGKAREKCLSEGNKFVFNPNALNEEITAITEGEFDALSIMFATDEGVKVCALGGAGLFGDLKKRLASKERSPKIVILFDKDEHTKTKSGQKGAAELLKELSEIGIVATVKYFDDFMTEEQKKLVEDNGGKIDANEILQKFGAQALKVLTEKIISSARADFPAIEERINQSINLQTSPKNKTRRENYSVEIEDLIREINTTVTSADLEAAGYLTHSERGSARPDGFCCPFCGSGNGEHKTGAFKYITDDGEPHFGCGKCGRGGNVITLIAYLENLPTSGKGFFETLKFIADKFHVHYEPKIFTAPTTKSVIAKLNFSDEIKNEIEEWEDINGTIDPKILPKLDAAQKFIGGLSPLNFKAAFAYEPATRTKVALCKFYLPSIAQKFFDTLKNARSLSREILKQISHETAALEKAGETVPTVDITEITRLSEIAPSKILEEVEITVTALKRKHKSFFSHYQAMQRAEAQKAALDAYNANPAWTQKKIPDCPINLILPDSVYFSAREVGTQTINENGRAITHAATKSPIVPTKIFRTFQSHTTQYEVAIKTRKHWRHIIVDGDELADSRKILRLAKDGGAIIKDAKALTNFFAEIIAANEERLPEITCYTRPGWHGDKFIYPTPDAEENYRVIRNGIDYDSIFKTQGDKDEWLAKFWEIVNGNQGSLKRIVIGASLLAPILKVVKIPNPQFNLWGTSDFAKTPLEKFGISIYGDPSAGAMLRTWNSTSKNMLTMAAGFNDFPLMIDEGETMSRRTQAEFLEYVYNFSIGVIGQANKRNGDVRVTENFRGVRFSTAERPLHDTSDKRGAFKRLIDIHVTEQLFDNDYARNLHIFCENNFGHFGRQWTRYIFDNRDKIRADFERTEKYFADDGFTRDGLHAEYKSVDATNARAIIGCAVAYRHFCACLEIEDEFDFTGARNDAAVILAQLPTVEEISDVNRSIRLLASWVAEHPRNFITPAKLNGAEVDGMDEPAQSYTVTVGKKFTDGRIAFFTNAFRKIISEIGLPSYEKVLTDLYDADLLDCKSSREKCKVIKIDGKPQRAYVVNSEAFAVDDSENS